MSEKVQVKNLVIPDYSGSRTVQLNGEFTENDLTEKLIESWVPIVECHRKCLAARICTFAQDPHKEALCGFKAKAVATFVEWTFEDLKNQNTAEIEKMLTAGFHLTEFMYVGQFYNGMMLDDDAKAWCSPQGKSMMFQILKLRDHLNAAATNVTEVVDDFTKTSITFVEGESEKVLLDLLKNEMSLLNGDMQIESYGGEGNANPKRSAMLIESRINEGYLIRVQGDRDGHERSSIDKLQASLNLVDKQVFAFKYDLESAYPPKILADVLGKLGLLSEDQVDKFSYDGSLPVSRYIQDVFNVDISSYKVKIAELVGIKLIESGLAYAKPDHNFLNKNELGKFILFCSWWSNG